MHINKIHKIDGVSFVNPSEILAKLFDAIPNIYGTIGIILIIIGVIMVNYLGRLN
jgi:uncharacterized membrane protein